METKTIEGTWDEISRRAPEFAGHRLRITVLDDSPPPPTPVPDELLDREFLAYCDREADDTVTLEQVLQTTSKIEDSMARILIDEARAERF